MTTTDPTTRRPVTVDVVLEGDEQWVETQLPTRHLLAALTDAIRTRDLVAEANTLIWSQNPARIAIAIDALAADPVVARAFLLRDEPDRAEELAREYDEAARRREMCVRCGGRLADVDVCGVCLDADGSI